MSTYRIVTVEGETVRVYPWKIGPYQTNQSLPLTCGHRHVNGSTVWCSVGDKVALCERCCEKAAQR